MKKLREKKEIIEIKNGLNSDITILVFLENLNTKHMENNRKKKNLWLGLVVIILIKMPKDAKDLKSININGILIAFNLL